MANTYNLRQYIKILNLLWICAPCITQASAYPPHPTVLEVRSHEDLLPAELKSPALHNPRLWKILPLTSLPHHGEKLVYRRPSDEIPRASIFSMLTHAGFARRQPHYHHNVLLPSLHEFLEPPPYPSQDFLQHL